MTDRESKYPTILDLFIAKPHVYNRLEARITGKRAILLAIEESRERGRFTFTFPILGGDIRGVRQAANDLRAGRSDVYYNEVILKT